MSDWYYTPVFAEDDLQDEAIQGGKAGPGPDTLLINGTNGVNDGNYATIDFTPGKSHRLRLVNTAVEDAVRVSIDNHPLQVIAADFTPIHPVWTDSVILGIGQRYDVIVHANQSVNSYWLRATTGFECSDFGPSTPAQAIVRYNGAATANPTTSSTATSSNCGDPGVLVPFVPNQVGSEQDFKAQARDLDVNLYLPGMTTNKQNIVYWGINATSIQVQWDDPTLQYVKTKNTSYPVVENIVELPTGNIWTYWVIQEVQGGLGPAYHPMHLHGHDFYVLGSGPGQFDFNSDPNNLIYDNPIRRDTAQLPPNGWLALAFPTDNPGACKSKTLHQFLGQVADASLQGYFIVTSHGICRKVSVFNS